MAEWYYILEGEEQGPISEDDLKHIFDSGALPLTTPVWREGMDDWVAAETSPLYMIAATSAPQDVKKASLIFEPPEIPRRKWNPKLTFQLWH